MISILQDLKFAARSLCRNPGFTFTAVLTLVLGIGVTAAIFSVANGVLFSPLPYADSDEVVTIWSSWNNFPDKTWVSTQEYTYWYQQNRTLEDVALYQTGSVNFTSAENPERVGSRPVPKFSPRGWFEVSTGLLAHSSYSTRKQSTTFSPAARDAGRITATLAASRSPALAPANAVRSRGATSSR